MKIDALKGDPSDLDGALFDVIVCAQAYHHFEDPVQMTLALAQRLKPQGRLFVIDLVAHENLEKFFDTLHGGESHAHIVPHKHGLLTLERIVF